MAARKRSGSLLEQIRQNIISGNYVMSFSFWLAKLNGTEMCVLSDLAICEHISQDDIKVKTTSKSRTIGPIRRCLETVEIKIGVNGSYSSESATMAKK